jgi:hypothetical protein
MQEKVITIPFNASFFLNGQKAIWAFLVSKSIERNIFFTLLAASLLAINLMFERRSGFLWITMFNGGYLFYMIFFWIGLFERKVKYLRRTKKQALHHEEEEMVSTFVFSDNGLEYTDNEKSFKFIWALFKPIVLYKDNILLILKDGGTICSIGRLEIGEADFDELCKNKIG